MRTISSLLLFFCVLTTQAQYEFSGQIDKNHWHEDVYLSVIEDYRKISGIYAEQIVSRAKADSLGIFRFTGNQLEAKNRIYRIHVDNCFDGEQGQNHFNGHCDDSKEVIFIAKNTDTIVFPFSFEKQMFCDIRSTNEKTEVFTKIDSIREEMKYAFGEFRSEANRQLNSKKWFKTLQEYGKNLNEPIAEVYIYAFLSDRSNDLHGHYLEDLKNNTYYDDLLERLKDHYPNSGYTRQYEEELASDKYIVSGYKKPSKWLYALIPVCILSLGFNFYLASRIKKLQSRKTGAKKDQLTNQEQKILEMLLENQTNKTIAEQLFVSVSTVKSHINNIYKKLNVNSREEAKSLFKN